MSERTKTLQPAGRRKSTIGRPRVLTDKQVAIILAWREAISAWKASRAAILTIRQLAVSLGVTHGAIATVIRQRGELKRASPDRREVE